MYKPHSLLGEMSQEETPSPAIQSIAQDIKPDMPNLKTGFDMNVIRDEQGFIAKIEVRPPKTENSP